MKVRSIGLLPAFVLLSLFIPGSAGQSSREQKPNLDNQLSLQLKTELMEVRMVVTDKRGEPVLNLKKSDFELRENGKRQEISFFSEDYIGDTATNRLLESSGGLPAVPGKPPVTVLARAVVLFVDTLNMSADHLSRVKLELRKFIEKDLGQTDLVALVSSSGSTGIASQFSRNREVLSRAIDRLTAWKPVVESQFSPLLASRVQRDDPSALDLAIEILRVEDNLNGSAMDRKILEFYAKNKAMQVLTQATQQRTATLATLGAVADQLATIKGQRLLVLFSDGFTSMGRAGSSQEHDVQRAISRAVRAGVIIYSVDANGLAGPAAFNATNRSVDPAFFGSMMSNITSSEEELREGLNALASDTGGEAFFRTNDMGASLRKALDSNQRFYSLAYYPPDQKDTKKFRRIVVTVKGHPDYAVRAQRGYYFEEKPAVAEDSSSLSPQDRLFKALASPLPVPDLPVDITADYIEREGDNSQVTVSSFIGGDRLDYKGETLQSLMKLLVATTAFDEGGHTAAANVETVEGKIPAEDLAFAKSLGFLHQKRINLKPGVYQIRVGVMEPDTHRIGTASAWVEVPDLGKTSLTISSLFIARDQSEPETSKVSLAQAEASSSHQSCSLRSFTGGDTIVYYFRIYNLPEPPEDSTLMMQMEFVQGENSVVKTDWQPIAARVIGKDGIGVDLGGRLVLDNFPSGSYEARVTIRDSKTGRILQRTKSLGIVSPH